jgi:hypothetical protein
MNLPAPSRFKIPQGFTSSNNLTSGKLEMLDLEREECEREMREG